MAVSLLTLVVEVLKRGGWCEEFTASSGTTTTVVDSTKLKDTGESSFAYEDKWAFWTQTSGSNLYTIRRVDSYSPTSGTLSVGNAFAAVPGVGDKLQLCDMNPDLVLDCVVTALRRCTYAREDSITWTTGQNRVDISSQLTWVQVPEQILRIRYRTAHPTIANQYMFTPFPPYEWEVDQNNTNLYIEFAGPLRSTADANTTLWVKSVAPYVLDSQLSSSFTYASTFTIPLDWAVAMGTVELINRIGRNVDLMNRGMFRLDLATEANNANELAAKFAPALNYNVRISD